jgi:hypothetical protein
MFVQVIQGQVGDRELWRRQSASWTTEIKPKTSGYLGSTSGLTADGYALAVVRFESQAAAEANSHLPEQDAWFATLASAYSGEIVFHDCVEVDQVLAGGSSDAGFVQIVQARAKDPAAFRAFSKEMEPELRKMRPDLFGGLVAWHGDGGGFTQTGYFTSESDARLNEKGMGESPLMAQFMDHIDGEMTFYDLIEPDID